MEERLNEIEARIAFMDKAIEELDDALVGQQKQLDRLEQMMADIAKHFQDMANNPTNAGRNING